MSLEGRPTRQRHRGSGRPTEPRDQPIVRSRLWVPGRCAAILAEQDAGVSCSGSSGGRQARERSHSPAQALLLDVGPGKGRPATRARRSETAAEASSTWVAHFSCAYAKWPAGRGMSGFSRRGPWGILPPRGTVRFAGAGRSSTPSLGGPNDSARRGCPPHRARWPGTCGPPADRLARPSKNRSVTIDKARLRSSRETPAHVRRGSPDNHVLACHGKSPTQTHGRFPGSCIEESR